MFGNTNGKVKELEKLVSKLTDSLKKLEQEREDRHKMYANSEEAYVKEIKELRVVERTLAKKFDEEKALAYKTMELEFKGKQMDELQKVRSEYDAKLMKMTEENYSKLKDSLAKLHEEGNAQTKFTEQIALRMVGELGGKKPKQLT